MSNPTSDIPNSPKAVTDETSATTTTTTTPNDSANVVELSGASRTESGTSESSPDIQARPDREKQNRSGGRLVTLLGVLLLISVFMNFYQAQQQTNLAAQSGEIETALDRAMTRIDEETLRANDAEGTLSEVDRNVDNVQERINALQAALAELSKVTAR